MYHIGWMPEHSNLIGWMPEHSNIIGWMPEHSDLGPLLFSDVHHPPNIIAVTPALPAVTSHLR